ncbi:DUF6950 family protein [Novosphingobium olei]|uniref:DUF6950 family protein n=1 Tax=Novosphingobium olei TaxID=2728851 RepID=UPI003089ADD3|nr:hypothetical protein NSDW_11600 [Novosphingobium olei]
MTELGEFLQEVAHRRREIGVWDCCTFPAAWLMWRGLPDPMADFRGTYDGNDEATDLVEAFEIAASSVGLVGVNDPREGDIGVVSVLGHQAGAIFTGKRWALVADRGLAFASVERECVWKVWRYG